MITRESIITAARSFLGVRYRHQQSDRSVGMDCIGFICAISRAIGYLDYKPPAYRVNPDPILFTKLLYENFDSIWAKDLKPGDIFCMDYGNGGIQHVGIFLPGNRIIHSELQFKCVAEHDIDPAWQAKIDLAKIAFTWRGLVETI